MYSIPQQAVTNGYTKIEYLRAHATALSSFDVKNPGPSPDSIPITLSPVIDLAVPNISKEKGPSTEESGGDLNIKSLSLRALEFWRLSFLKGFCR
jgi:hypothetical protein